jgi:hypothetical protein
LRGVTGSGGTLFIESRAELGKLFGGGASADTIILINNDDRFVTFLIFDSSLDGDDFRLEPAVLLGGKGTSVRFSSEFVLLGTRDLEVSGNVFRGETIVRGKYSKSRMSPPVVLFINALLTPWE